MATPSALSWNTRLTTALTWQPIATGLSGAVPIDWTPTFAPVGTSRLRITASDGFNTGQSVSEIFYIQPTNPVAIIQEPAEWDEYPGRQPGLPGRR